MTNSEIENSETLVDVRIFRIPIEDFEYWMKIVRANGGNRQRVFRMLLDCYAYMQLLGKLNTELQTLVERVDALEQNWRREGGNLGIKTFGGGEI